MTRFLQFPTVALSIGGAVLLVMGWWFGYQRPFTFHRAPSLSAAADVDFDTPTVWMPPCEEFKLRALPAGQRPWFGVGTIRYGDVRPAWFAFAATVAIFAVLWIIIEHAPSPLFDVSALVESIHR